ncbi:hypothetical protein EBN03_11995 [Nocardia stercoris]|uniref:Uncharacterized protein n=1 Tax=Nocardia stercoris TaxID=2483361 RepID=A0A3M2L4R8_9NOCA|nr:hypothetical protein EBN03_11995 [Nocardia stercoris]
MLPLHLKPITLRLANESTREPTTQQVDDIALHQLASCRVQESNDFQAIVSDQPHILTSNANTKSQLYVPPSSIVTAVLLLTDQRHPLSIE